MQKTTEYLSKSPKNVKFKMKFRLQSNICKANKHRFIVVKAINNCQDKHNYLSQQNVYLYNNYHKENNIIVYIIII